jgi:hypothetical protein
LHRQSLELFDGVGCIFSALFRFAGPPCHGPTNLHWKVCELHATHPNVSARQAAE